MTYSVILSRSHITPFRKRAVYRFLSEVLIEGLQNLGISADFSRTRMGSFQNPDCFGTTGQFEIVTSSGRKIIGSAQSTSRVSCLQHGSIPLTKSQMRLASYFIDAPSHANTDSTSIGEELGRQVDLAKVVEAFYRAFDRVFTLKPSEMTQRERTLAAELFKTKYLSSTWNLKL
jgi:lipoate-protein ligase A